MTAASTLLAVGAAVAGPRFSRRRAAPSTSRGRAGAHLASGRQLRPALILSYSFGGAPSPPARKHLLRPPPPPAASAGEAKPEGFAERYPALVTGFFFFMWYFLNVIFNILNKKIFDYFPYPYFVSVSHLFVGVLYCLVGWSVGLSKRAVFSCPRPSSPIVHHCQ